MGVLAGPGAGFFEGGGGLDYEWVLEAASGDLQAGGEAVAGEAAGDGGGGLAGEVEGKTAANPVILNAVKDLLRCRGRTGMRGRSFALLRMTQGVWSEAGGVVRKESFE